MESWAATPSFYRLKIPVRYLSSCSFASLRYILVVQPAGTTAHLLSQWNPTTILPKSQNFFIWLYQVLRQCYYRCNSHAKAVLPTPKTPLPNPLSIIYDAILYPRIMAIPSSSVQFAPLSLKYCRRLSERCIHGPQSRFSGPLTYRITVESVCKHLR